MSISEKRERVFMVLAAFFFAAMTLLNVVGITKFIQFGPLALAVGVLPYPLTFLITDLISELYGKSRANFVVWVGLAINVFVIGILYFGQWMPSVPIESQPPWQNLIVSNEIQLPNGNTVQGSIELFYFIYACSTGAVIASMLSYIAAQFCDVHIYHYLKKLTKGKHLWVRNNFSTLTSQLVDSVMVISVTFGGLLLAGKMSWESFLLLMGSNYLFKMVAALLDTIPFYLLVYYLRSYLQLSDETL